MTVSRHLLIVALLSLLPSTAAGLFTQFSLQTRRTGELSELAMRQAELSEADLLSIIDTARQLGVIATRFTEVEQLQPECAQQLSVLHTRLARYALPRRLSPGWHPGLQLRAATRRRQSALAT